MEIIEIYLLFSMMVVLWFDLTRYVIPNWVSGSLLGLYPIAVMMAHHSVDWKMAVCGMLLVLAVGYGIFVMKWMGGGDIKLLTACALWVGFKNLPEFLVYVSLIGGAISLGLLFLRKAPAYVPQLAARTLPRILQEGAPVPYGIAIAAEFLAMLWLGKIPMLH